MPTFDIIKISEYKDTFRNENIKSQFDLNIEKIKESFRGEIPIENIDWNIGIITGASGTGKSTIAKEIFKDNYIINFKYNNESVIDNMPKEKSVKEITKIFNSVGFATVWSWLKPYSVLSEGEKMRVNLARAILENKNKIVFDEFTSVVNREVAKHSSYAISKAIRKLNKQFIAVTCHSDIIEWLEPDWIFDTNTMTFQLTRGLVRRPNIEFTIKECDKSLWTNFRKYHYLNSELNKSAKCFVGLINNIPVSFFAVLHFPHSRVKNFKRGHRLVVLPDYQGLGIGHLLSSKIAEYFVKKGFRFIITSSIKSLLQQRMNDKNWIVTRQSRSGSGSGVFQNKNIKGSTSCKKYTYGYEYKMKEVS